MEENNVSKHEKAVIGMCNSHLQKLLWETVSEAPLCFCKSLRLSHLDVAKNDTQKGTWPPDGQKVRGL